MKLFYRCTSERKAQSVEMDQESGVGSSSASGGGSSSEEQDNGGSCEDTSSSSFYTSSESGPDIAGVLKVYYSFTCCNYLTIRCPI